MTVKCGLMQPERQIWLMKRKEGMTRDGISRNRTMTASLMLGAMLKGEDKLTVKIEGGRSEPLSQMRTQRVR